MAEVGRKEYLGDSVYVEIEDGMFKLTTDNGDPNDPRNVIYLELAVYFALKRYADRLFAATHEPADGEDQ